MYIVRLYVDTSIMHQLSIVLYFFVHFNAIGIFELTSVPVREILVSPLMIETVTFCLWGGSDRDELPGLSNATVHLLLCYDDKFVMRKM